MIEILLLIILILIHGFFSAAEMSLFDLEEWRLGRDKKSMQIKKVLRNPAKYIASIQTSITVTGFLASAFAAENFASKWAPHIHISFLSSETILNLMIVLLTLGLSYLTLVFGEVIPKQLALLYPKKIAKIVITPVYIVTVLFYPFVWILTKTTNTIMRLFHLRKGKDEIQEIEIRRLLSMASKTKNISSYEKNLIFHVFDLNDISVDQVMIPIKKVEMIDIREKFNHILLKIRNSRYSKFPVYEENKQNIIGILSVKSLLLKYKKKTNPRLHDLLFAPLFIENTMVLENAFEKMRINSASMAIIKEQEKIIGIVTIEDLIEAVMGSIYDEDDIKEQKDCSTKKKTLKKRTNNAI